MYIFGNHEISDGFNHIALEAIYSQKIGSNIQLLLSNIGITDYIRGFNLIRYDLESDVDVLYKALKSSYIKRELKQLKLMASSRSLQTRFWVEDIISTHKQIIESKHND